MKREKTEMSEAKRPRHVKWRRDREEDEGRVGREKKER